MRVRDSNLWLGAAAGLALLPTTIFIAVSVLLALGLRINAPLANLLVGAAFSLSLWGAYAASRQVWACVLVLLVALLAALFSHFLIDTTFDGQQYHFHGAFALSRGWNPFWEPLPAAPWGAGRAEEMSRIWTTHYPQATWRVAAVQMAAGLDQEAAKAANPILACAMLFAFVGIGLRLTKSIWISLALAIAFAANPVIIAQLPTRYVDGALAACFALTAVFAFAWIESRRLVFAATLFAVLAFAVNLKFSAAPVFAVLCVLLIAATWALKNRRDAIRLGALALTAGAAGVFIFGFAPYARNALDFHHPFYPVMGPNHVEVMAYNYPIGFEALSAWGRMFCSLFSETAAGYATPYTLKWPFMISADEIRAIGSADTRLGGFGPLFAASLVGALIAAAGVFAFDRSNKNAMLYLGGAAALFATAIAMPEAWWARYAPQFWWVPALVVIALLLSRVRGLRIAGTAVAALIAVNGALAAYAMLSVNYSASRSVRWELARIKQAGGAVMAHVGHSPARFGLIASTGVKIIPSATALPEQCSPQGLSHAMPLVDGPPPSYCFVDSPN